jgi:hypothetical protein
MMLSGDSVRMEVGVLIMMLLIRLPTVPLCLPCFVLGSCLPYLSAQESGFPIRKFMLVPSVDLNLGSFLSPDSFSL